MVSMASPTHRIFVRDDDPDALATIRAELDALADKGERPWAEVAYEAPHDLTDEQKAQWAIDTEATFDAVELVDGEIVTLAPYAEEATDGR